MHGNWLTAVPWWGWLLLAASWLPVGAISIRIANAIDVWDSDIPDAAGIAFGFLTAAMTLVLAFAAGCMLVWEGLKRLAGIKE